MYTLHGSTLRLPMGTCMLHGDEAAYCFIIIQDILVQMFIMGKIV